MTSDTNKAQQFPGKPPRLETIFARFKTPLFFVTFNTAERRKLLANAAVHDAFRSYALRGTELGKAFVGRYVIMPDHIHVFVAGNDEFDLGVWVRGLKRAISKALPAPDPDHWQPGFFDHLKRSDESYTEKWRYVQLNPVRAGLVRLPEEYAFQGEIVKIDRV